MTTAPRPPCRIVKVAWLAGLMMAPIARRPQRLRHATLRAFDAIDADDAPALVLALEDIGEETAGETRRLAGGTADAVRRAMAEQGEESAQAWDARRYAEATADADA